MDVRFSTRFIPATLPIVPSPGNSTINRVLPLTFTVNLSYAEELALRRREVYSHRTATPSVDVIRCLGPLGMRPREADGSQGLLTRILGLVDTTLTRSGTCEKPKDKKSAVYRITGLHLAHIGMLITYQ